MTDPQPVTPEQIAAIRERLGACHRQFASWDDVHVLLQALEERDKEIASAHKAGDALQDKIDRLEHRLAELEARPEGVAENPLTGELLP